jgi:hypothetical protein
VILTACGLVRRVTCSKLIKFGWCKRIGRSKNDKAKINKKTSIDDKPKKKAKK